MGFFEEFAAPSVSHPEGQWSAWTWSELLRDNVRWRWVDYRGRVLEQEAQCRPKSVASMDDYPPGGAWSAWTDRPALKAKSCERYNETDRTVTARYSFNHDPNQRGVSPTITSEVAKPGETPSNQTRNYTVQNITYNVQNNLYQTNYSGPGFPFDATLTGWVPYTNNGTPQHPRITEQ